MALRSTAGVVLRYSQWAAKAHMFGIPARAINSLRKTVRVCFQKNQCMLRQCAERLVG